MEKENRIKKMYDIQFEGYCKKQNTYRPAVDIRQKMYKILGNIRKKTILFAGCGDGTECIPAVKLGAKVTGIDISNKAIELAKKNKLLKNTNFQVMDFEKNKFHR